MAGARSLTQGGMGFRVGSLPSDQLAVLPLLGAAARDGTYCNGLGLPTSSRDQGNPLQRPI